MKLQDITEAGSHERDLTSVHFKLKDWYGVASYYGDVDVRGTELTSLKGSPNEVTGEFDCANNSLISLEHSPRIIEYGFDCSNNQLTSLVGGPQKVTRTYNCSANRQLSSLEGGPEFVERTFHCSHTGLVSLHNVHKIIKHCKRFAAAKTPIISHVLGLLLIENLQDVILQNAQVTKIVQDHLPSKGRESVLDCQEALMEAGFDLYAHL